MPFGQWGERTILAYRVYEQFSELLVREPSLVCPYRDREIIFDVPIPYYGGPIPAVLALAKFEPELEWVQFDRYSQGVYGPKYLVDHVLISHGSDVLHVKYCDVQAWQNRTAATIGTLGTLDDLTSAVRCSLSAGWRKAAATCLCTRTI